MYVEQTCQLMIPMKYEKYRKFTTSIDLHAWKVGDDNSKRGTMDRFCKRGFGLAAGGIDQN